jgi:hypothetical protein
VPDDGTRSVLQAPESEPEAAGKVTLARRDLHLDRLEERYTTVVDLAESIQKHLEQQGQRAERMAHSLDRLAAILEHMPEASQTHADLLSSINELMETDTASAERALELLSQIPQVADAQRETMVSIGRQLDVLREGGERGTDTLADLQAAVLKLGEVTETSSAALKHMHADSVTREERLADLIREQTSRLTLFASLAITVAAIAVVLGLVAVFR